VAYDWPTTKLLGGPSAANQTNEVSLQLLDALTRLEQLDRRFQNRSCPPAAPDGSLEEVRQ